MLLEAPARPHLKNSVLLTVDLTQAVVDEAIERKDSVIVTYRKYSVFQIQIQTFQSADLITDPIVFRPLKGLTLANTQQASLLRCAQEGISIYSPHTAVDASPRGTNEWLADVVTE